MVVQAIGGAIASMGETLEEANRGGRIMLGGIAFQLGKSIAMMPRPLCSLTCPYSYYRDLLHHGCRVLRKVLHRQAHPKPWHEAQRFPCSWRVDEQHPDDAGWACAQHHLFIHSASLLHYMSCSIMLNESTERYTGPLSYPTDGMAESSGPSFTSVCSGLLSPYCEI